MAVRVALDGADAAANVKIKVIKLSVDIWLIFPSPPAIEESMRR